MDNKLIRIHTEEKDATFNAEFRDGIVLPPNSEIALQAITMNRVLEFLNITGISARLTFRFGDLANQKEVFMKVGQYTRSNILSFFSDIQDKMNNLLSVGVPAEFGRQVNWAINSDNKLQIDMTKGNFEILSASGARQNPNATYIQTQTTGNRLKNAGASVVETDVSTSFCVLNKTFTRGCGVFRVRIRELINDVTQAGQGFTIALVEQANYNKVRARNHTEADFDFAIRARAPADVLQIKHSTSGGVFANTAVNLNKVDTAGDIGENDILDIRLSQGKIQLVHYKEQAPVATNILHEEDFDRTKYYYPIVCFASQIDRCQLDRVNITPDPFHVNDPAFNVVTHGSGDLLDATLEAPNGSAAAQVHKIVFDDLSVAQYLGFDTADLNVNNEAAASGQFIANKSLDNIVSSDSFIVELLNIPIESYDSLSGGRKNILAVAPITERIQDANTGIIDYSPNEMFFISLKNRNPLSLRNIKARVTSEVGNPVTTEGVSTMILVVRPSRHKMA